jgi:hypothetical protein
MESRPTNDSGGDFSTGRRSAEPPTINQSKDARLGPEHPNIWGHDGACPSTKLLSALHRSRGYDQFVTLQRRHFDVPPKIVGVGALARFPTKAFVKAAIE